MFTTKSPLLKRSFQFLQRGLVNLTLSKKLFMPLEHNFQGIRTLYSLTNLGINAFILSNEELRNECGNKEKFLQNLSKFSLEDKKVFPEEDLSFLIAYCQEDKSLLNDVIKFSKIYYDQVRDLGPEVYPFGPTIMRLMHYLDCPDEALKIFLDEDFGNCFSQITSCQTLMNLLYENERYEEVKIIMEKIFFMDLYQIPVICLNLVLAANYKLGTDEALTDSMDYFRKASASYKNILLRPLSFTAGLALKLGKPQMTAQLLSKADSASNSSISNLNVLSKVRLGQVDEVLAILKSRVLIDVPKSSSSAGNNIYCLEVIDEVEKIVNNTDDMKKIAQMKYLKQVLYNMKLISPQTLDECLCSPITTASRHHFSLRYEDHV